MAPRTLRAQQVSDVVCEGLGEGPVWDPATAVVHLVDLEDGGLLTARLRADDYRVLDGPRTTGDGYYESVVLDPDGNRIEITV